MDGKEWKGILETLKVPIDDKLEVLQEDFKKLLVEVL